MGKLCIGKRRPDYVRLGLRSLHPGPEHSPFNLRNQRGEESSHRIPQFLEDSGFHRSTLRIHGCPERTERLHAGRRTGTVEQTVEPPADDQIQRNQLYHPAGCRSGLLSGRQRTGKGYDSLLYDQRTDYERSPSGLRVEGVWRRKRPLPLGESPERSHLLEIL